MNAVRGLGRLNILKRIRIPSQNVNCQIVRQSSSPVSHGHEHGKDHSHDHDDDDALVYNYRYGCYQKETPPRGYFQAEVFMTVFWWWILWHVITEPEVMFGTENPATYPELWTDEELGIPPDDE